MKSSHNFARPWILPSSVKKSWLETAKHQTAVSISETHIPSKNEVMQDYVLCTGPGICFHWTLSLVPILHTGQAIYFASCFNGRIHCAHCLHARGTCSHLEDIWMKALGAPWFWLSLAVPERTHFLSPPIGLKQDSNFHQLQTAYLEATHESILKFIAVSQIKMKASLP